STEHRRNPKIEFVKIAATIAWRYVAYRRNPAAASARYAAPRATSACTSWPRAIITDGPSSRGAGQPAACRPPRAGRAARYRRSRPVQRIVDAALELPVEL